jgi:hypothetical protein
MEMIEVPRGQVLVQLLSIEMIAGWKAFENVRNGMDQKSFRGYLHITTKGADELAHKLTAAVNFT